MLPGTRFITVMTFVLPFYSYITSWPVLYSFLLRKRGSSYRYVQETLFGPRFCRLQALQHNQHIRTTPRPSLQSGKWPSPSPTKPFREKELQRTLTNASSYICLLVLRERSRKSSTSGSSTKVAVRVRFSSVHGYSSIC